MSSQPQATDAQTIDQVVLTSLERRSGVPTDWGTPISDLSMDRGEKAAVVEEIFLLLLPEYEWTAQDMTCLQELPTVEEWIGFFEGLCDEQDAPEEKMFTFNFN